MSKTLRESENRIQKDGKIHNTVSNLLCDSSQPIFMFLQLFAFLYFILVWGGQKFSYLASE